MGDNFDHESVNGLRLPRLLLDLIAAGRWVGIGPAQLRDFIPSLAEPMNFLSVKRMAIESMGKTADNERASIQFHDYRGLSGLQKKLPWRDVDRSIIIGTALCDTAISLDFRGDPKDPSVIATDWNNCQNHWREIASSFPAFARLLDL